MARQRQHDSDDELLVYRGDEAPAPPIPLKTRLWFVGATLLLIAIGSLYLFKDEIVPKPKPPKTVTVSVTRGDALSSWPVGGQLTRLAPDKADVWGIIPARKQVVKISAATNKVVAKTTLSQTPHDLAIGRGGVWVSGETAVYRLDVDTGRITKEVPSGNAPGDITLQGNNVWVINTADDTVSKIDSTLGTVLKTVPVAPDPFDLAATSKAIWVAHGSLDADIQATPLLTKIDVRSGVVVNETETAVDLRGITATKTSLWTAHGQDHGLGKYSVKSGEQVGNSLLTLPGAPTAIYQANQQLYVSIAGRPESIAVVDRVSGRVIEQKKTANASGVWIAREGAAKVVRWQRCSEAVPCRVQRLESQ
jgi:glutamine cyclotransferase